MAEAAAQCDVAVVGAGAAGLSAAIFAAQTAREAGRPMSVVALDGAKSIGAKILVSGGGRCNITHDEIHIADYNGSRNIVRNILAAFDERATVRWFESLGVQLKREETGKLFPTSDSAKMVLGALLRRCDELGVRVLTSCRVHEVSPPAAADVSDAAGALPARGAKGRALAASCQWHTAPFTISHSNGQLLANRVVLATGGRSLPRTGSDGEGWQIAQRLGHTVTETYPALVPLVLEDSFFHAELSGQSLDVELSTFAQRKLIDRRRGSLLWTHFGISGPVVMDASRHWVIAHARGQEPQIKCSLLPGRAMADVERWLIEAIARHPRQSIAAIMREELPERLAVAVIGHVGIDPQLAASQVRREDRRKLSLALTELELPVVRDRGWNYAEVTAGGVPLGEIDYRTMQSRKVAGVHLVGEMLDCDGRIGGFNFQWAWATGYVAGRACSGAATPRMQDVRE